MSSSKLERLQNKFANMPDVTSAKATPPVVSGTVQAPPASAPVNTPQMPPVVQGYTSSNPAPSTPQPAPTTNYGGTGNPLNEILYSKKQYDAGNKGWAANNAKQYYSMLDPTESAAVSKMNTQQLTDYINSKNAPRPSAPSAPATPQMPQIAAPQQPSYASNMPYMQLTPQAIETQADYQIETERANRKRALDSSLAALKSNFYYSQGITRDNRVLEDAQFARTNAPASWDGSTSYRGAMMDRNRSIQDTAVQRDFNNQVATLQQAFNDWENLSTQQRQQLINDMTRLERDYGLQVGQLTGNFNGQRTLAGQQFDWSRQVDAANLTGYLGGQQTLAGLQADRSYGLDYANTFGTGLNGQTSLAGRQANLNAALSYMDATGRVLTPQTDWSGYARQAQNPNTPLTAAERQRQIQNQQFERQQGFNEQQQGWENAYRVARDSIADRQWQAIFDRDVQQFGLNYALQQLSQQNDQAYRQAQLGLAQDDNARAWATLDYEMSQPAGGQQGGLSANQLLQSMQSLYSEPVMTKDALGNTVESGQTRLTTDPARREQMFLNVVDAGLSDAETTQILAALGMAKNEIDKYTKKYAGE